MDDLLGAIRLLATQSLASQESCQRGRRTNDHSADSLQVGTRRRTPLSTPPHRSSRPHHFRVPAVHALALEALVSLGPPTLRHA
jgi:hypothetical protein